MTKHTYSLDYDDISDVVKNYNFNGVGYGMLLIVESFEKIDNSVFIWVVYIQNSNGQIVSARRYIGGDYGGKGDKCSKEGIKLVIKLSGKDLRNYK
jgi:hypothetical protein